MAHAGRRVPAWRQRSASADSAAEELEAAYDHLKSACAKACRRRRDGDARAACVLAAEAVMRDAARALHAAAEHVEHAMREHGA